MFHITGSTAGLAFLREFTNIIWPGLSETTVPGFSISASSKGQGHAQPLMGCFVWRHQLANKACTIHVSLARSCWVRSSVGGNQK